MSVVATAYASISPYPENWALGFAGSVSATGDATAGTIELDLLLPPAYSDKPLYLLVDRVFVRTSNATTDTCEVQAATYGEVGMGGFPSAQLCQAGTLAYPGIGVFWNWNFIPIKMYMGLIARSGTDFFLRALISPNTNLKTYGAQFRGKLFTRPVLDMDWS